MQRLILTEARASVRNTVRLNTLEGVVRTHSLTCMDALTHPLDYSLTHPRHHMPRDQAFREQKLAKRRMGDQAVLQTAGLECESQVRARIGCSL